jgi:hypothetical protein
MSEPELTLFQRIEALKSPPNCWLSCALEERKRALFLFLQCLSKELHVRLGNEALQEPRDIVELADKKCALHSSQQHCGTAAS